jgi:RNA polymerase sigma factor (sigma-70 family)
MTATNDILQSAIERVRNGDRDAFRVVVEALHVQGYALTRRMMPTSEDAEDALQESFVRCYRGLATFRGSASIATWFYRIVYTTCLNMLDYQRRRPLLDSMDEELDIGDTVGENENDDMVPVVMDVLDTLPHHYRAILAMFYIQDCSIDDIRTITGLPQGTIKARLSRGRTMLRTAIAERLAIERKES